MNINCVICGELFTSSSDVLITPCGHMYHSQCILQWFERSKTCPQCRTKCIKASVIKVFFNINNLDISQMDIGTIQQDLDDQKLKNNELQKELESAQKEIINLKKIQKNCMKTISGLEEKLKSNQFLVESYHEQFKIFKGDKKMIDEQRKEIKDLKVKIDLMSTLDTILTSTISDVENLVKDCKNRESLATWVITLKRELRSCENKRTDLRNTLKVVQHNAHKDNIAKKLLTDKLNELESENYHLNKKLKDIINDNNNTEFLAAKYNNKTKLINSPTKSSSNNNKENDKIKNQLSTNNNNTPTLILKNLKVLEESSSPYLNIKSSSIGLSPLLKNTNRVRNHIVNKGNGDNLSEVDKISVCSSKGAIKKTTSDLSDKYTIFKKPRLNMTTSAPLTRNENFVSNGFGSSDRKLDENYTLNIKKNPNIKNFLKK